MTTQHCYEVTVRNKRLNHIYSIPIKAEGYGLRDTLAIITDKVETTEPYSELVSIRPLTSLEYIDASMPQH